MARDKRGIWVEVEVSPDSWLGITLASSLSWAQADVHRRATYAQSAGKRFRVAYGVPGERNYEPIVDSIRPKD